MRHLRGPLGHQQAAGRIGRKKAPPTGLTNQVFVVFVRLEAEQGQTKTVLACCLAVAPASVAAILGENRDNLVGEVQRSRLSRMNNADRKSRRHAVAALGRDHRRPIGYRDDAAGVIEPDNSRRFRAPTHLAAHVAGAIRGGQQLLSGILGIENQLASSGPIVQFERFTVEHAGAADQENHQRGHHPQKGSMGRLGGFWEGNPRGINEIGWKVHGRKPHQETNSRMG